MPKPIILLIILFLIVSCNEGVPIQQIDDPEEYTTEEIQDMEKEIIVVASDRDVVYIFDNNNMVKYKIINMYKPGDYMISVSLYIFLLFIAIVAVFVFSLFYYYRRKH